MTATSGTSFDSTDGLRTVVPHYNQLNFEVSRLGLCLQQAFAAHTRELECLSDAAQKISDAVAPPSPLVVKASSFESNSSEERSKDARAASAPEDDYRPLGRLGFPRVYLAACYSRKAEIREIGRLLSEAGIVVTSRWLDDLFPENSGLSDCTDEENTSACYSDLEDIDAAHALVFFAESPRAFWPRGGRHVEFGYALGRGKKIFVCGPRENIFHFHAGATPVRTIEAATWQTPDAYLVSADDLELAIFAWWKE